MNVKEMYNELIKQGVKPKDAAIDVQRKTGLSVVTGKPIKQKPLGQGKRISYGRFSIFE